MSKELIENNPSLEYMKKIDAIIHEETKRAQICFHSSSTPIIVDMLHQVLIENKIYTIIEVLLYSVLINLDGCVESLIKDQAQYALTECNLHIIIIKYMLSPSVFLFLQWFCMKICFNFIWLY